jgi:hypothetical protein
MLAGRFGPSATANYLSNPRTATFATRNLSTVLAGILIFFRLLGFKPVRTSLFCLMTKAWQNEFAVLFDCFINEGAERIEEYPSGLLIGLDCFAKSEFKFCFGHL